MLWTELVPEGSVSASVVVSVGLEDGTGVKFCTNTQRDCWPSKAYSPTMSPCIDVHLPTLGTQVFAQREVIPGPSKNTMYVKHRVYGFSVLLSEICRQKKSKNPVDAFGNRHSGNRGREVDTRVPQREAAFDVTVIVVTVVISAFVATYTHDL